MLPRSVMVAAPLVRPTLTYPSRRFVAGLSAFVMPPKVVMDAVTIAPKTWFKRQGAPVVLRPVLVI